ncbi:MAG TPA: amino acid permease [Jatrophihabitantaceae bacterium]
MPELLSTPRAAALYIGALLGPGLLLLPGLAARLAGPASILAWAGLLVLSALFATVFTALGIRFGSRTGVAGYVAAGLGPRAGRAVSWCFVTGVVLGAPLVCLIGGGYVAALFGGGRTLTVVLAVAMLVVVVALTAGGARASVAVQFGLVVLLVGLIAIAVVGSSGHLRADRWTPFAPHGWSAIGSAAAVLMLSFVGWEAIAPMTGRLREPARQLPRIIGIAFGVSATIYLALAAATIGVLGQRAGGGAPLAALMEVAIGPAGRVVAAVAAVGLTLAAVNAYVSGAAEMLAGARPGTPVRARLPLAIAAVGIVLLGLYALGRLSTARLVTLPTTLFLTVYLLCMLAASRLLRRARRIAAALALLVVAVVLGFCGWALAVAAGVGVIAFLLGRDEFRRNEPEPMRNPLLSRAGACG